MGRKPETAEQWIEKAEARWRGRFDYARVPEQWLNSRTKIEVGCPEHGWFKVIPSDHLFRMTSGCKKCGQVGKRRYEQNFVISHDRR